MIRSFYYATALMLSFLMLQSCTESRFEIKKFTAGGKGSKDAFIGQTLVIDAVLNLTSALNDIDITIEPVAGTGWRFEGHIDERPSKWGSVVVNKKINIPDTASTGRYVVTLVATQDDQQSIRKQMDVDFVIDSTVPILSPLDVGLNKAGNDLHVETEVTAAKKVAKIYILIEGEDWQQSYDFSQPKIAGKLSVHFHEHIDTNEAPKGVYEVTVTVEDEQGRKGTTNGSFEKK